MNEGHERERDRAPRRRNIWRKSKKRRRGRKRRKKN